LAIWLTSRQDGSVTGNIGGFVVPKWKFFEPAPNVCTVNQQWNATVCPSLAHQPYVYVRLTNVNTGATDFAGTNVMTVFDRATWYPLGSSLGADDALSIACVPEDQATRDT
jgi:hypothetical protein